MIYKKLNTIVAHSAVKDVVVHSVASSRARKCRHVTRSPACGNDRVRCCSGATGIDNYTRFSDFLKTKTVQCFIVRRTSPCS